MTRIENISCQSSDCEPWREGHKGWDFFLFCFFACFHQSEHMPQFAAFHLCSEHGEGCLPSPKQKLLIELEYRHGLDPLIMPLTGMPSLPSLPGDWLREPTEGLAPEGGWRAPVLSPHTRLLAISLGATSFEFLLSCSRSEGQRSNSWILTLGWVDASLQRWTECGY